MAATVSLVDVRTEALRRISMEYSTQLQIPELNWWINGSGAELHDHLVSAYGEKYALNEQQFASQVNKATYSFVTDIGAPNFYQLHGLDVQQGGYWIPVGEFKLAERERFQYPASNALYAWRFQGANLVIAPTPKAVVQFKLYYAPTWTKLVADTDTFDTIDGWDEFVVVDVAIKALAKLDRPADIFIGQKAAMVKRLTEMKMMRNTAAAPRIVDVNEDDDFFTRRMYGP